MSAGYRLGYAGQMRPYSGTEAVSGKEIGARLRAGASWNALKNPTVSINVEHMSAGDVLDQVVASSGTYGYVGATYRY